MTPYKKKVRKERVRKIAQELEKLFPEAKMGLTFRNNFEMLIAVIFSAQTTDKKVNEVTPAFFKKYPTPEKLAKAHLKDVETLINVIGLWKAKAKNVIKLSQILLEKHNGRVPRTMEELQELPGVGRKTANAVLNEAFDIQMGITVDTHVRRFALKFDLTDSKNPDRIEKDLMEILLKKEWATFSHRLIQYGREICPAHKHDCEGHPLTKVYPKAARVWPKAK
jgi:endonuclease-3